MTKIQLRRGTATQWTSVNPVLASGEMGIETDTNKFKFGDGITAWNSLDYVITGEVITDYTELDNLPSINNITLTGNKSASDLGLQEELINGTGILISGTTISVDDSVVAMRSDIPDVSNFVTNSSLSVTLQDYQLALESGTNIKTINNQSLLGSGNIEIQSGGTYSEGTGIDITNGVISVDTDTVALKSDLNNLVTVSGNNQQITGSKIFEGGLRVDSITSISNNNVPLIHYGSQGIEIGDVSTSLIFYGLNTRPQYMDGTSFILSDLALMSDIPSLTGYATQTWVQNQNYLTSSALNGYATESFVTSQGFLTGITSNDVTTALGYTPYSNANPDNYTSNVGTVTSVNGTQPDSNGNVSITIPDNTSFMDLSTNQTAYGTKTFNDLRVNQYIRNSSGKMIFNATGSSFSMGDTTCELTLDGSTTRPYYYNGTTNSEMALLSDIPDIDNSTITKNTSDELQTIAVIDDNSGNALKYWTGTKAQYDAITTKDANTLYNITDDTDVTLALLELLFPVGAVYFGTMSVCPLQTLGVGTWQALPQDKVIQIAGTRGNVGTTIEESLPNIKGSAITADPTGGTTISGRSYSGALARAGNTNVARITTSSYVSSTDYGISLDASRSSSTYQDGAPVQQDAYLLNGWRRIA